MPYSDPEARKEYMRQYREANKEKINEINRKSRKTANRKEKDRERYANDPEYRAKVQAKNKEQYQKHKAARNATQNARRRARREQMIERLGGCCEGCGSTERLEFDHIDRSQKVANVATLLDYSIERLTEEVDKCRLLCNRCHEIKTTINHDRDMLADGYRVVSVEEDGDEIVVRLKR